MGGSNDRILLCHPKQNWDQERITAALDFLKGKTNSEAVSGREAWEAHFVAVGRNWDRWAERVGRGTSLDGVPYYTIYVVPGLECARATAGILKHALAVGRTVLAWSEGSEQHPFRRVTGVVDGRPNDKFFGWRLVLA